MTDRAASPHRFDRLDLWRAAAMAWMACFHFSFDLNQFRVIAPQNFYADPFWTTQRLCIVSLFLLGAGASQAVAIAAGQTWRRFWRRWAQVASCALLVSIGSYVMFPLGWISFGVLHGMAVMLIVLRLLGTRLPPERLARSPRALAGLALAAAVAMSSACSVMPNTAPAYVEPPATVGSAKVRVVNAHPFAYYADIAVFDSPTCFTKANLGMTGGDSRDAQRIGMLDDKPVSAASLERSVRADEALVIGPRAVFPTVTSAELMRGLMPHTQDAVRARQAGVCRLRSFVPRAGEQYEVVVDLAPARCTVTPYRLVDDNGSVRREPVETQASQISTYEFDIKCFKSWPAP